MTNPSLALVLVTHTIIRPLPEVMLRESKHKLLRALQRVVVVLVLQRDIAELQQPLARRHQLELRLECDGYACLYW